MTEEFDVEEVAAVFGRTAVAYDSVIAYFTSFGAQLVEAAHLELGERVLDVGCGRGATLLPASVAVGPTGRVVGIDLAQEMVALLGADLEAAGVENATVRLGDAQALDMEEATFDVVLSQMVLHLLPDPAAAAAEAFRVLVPGGRCVMNAPSDSPGWEFLPRVDGTYLPRAGQPMAVPHDFDLPSTLAAAGFEVAQNDHVQVEFHFADEQDWWEWGWSNGIRALYESLPPDDLEALKREAFAELATRRTPAGIPFVSRVNVVRATKPSA
jgi:ubiquinone/menaquinone biosynthesis C-methylase UbiE